MSDSIPEGGDAARDALVRRHRAFGWWSLLVFLTLGMGLEALHAFKAGWFLDVDTEPRRLMLRLAHSHGTLFALVHLAFAAGIASLPLDRLPRAAVASACLIGASVLMPGGFLLGGLVVSGGDPGPGVVLAPIGGLLLAVGVFVAARIFTARRS